MPREKQQEQKKKKKFVDLLGRDEAPAFKIPQWLQPALVRRLIRMYEVDRDEEDLDVL